MSWALEEWKSELPSRALQKISEYESQLEKLKKERQQKQLQLDSLEVAFQKQNQKLEGERDENATLRRETQGLTEARNNLEKAQQRLCHEIQVKEALVCSLEGQLLATKKQIDSLEHELKRLEAELERSRRAPTSAECQLQLTPARIYPACTTLSSTNEGSKWDELQEKYNREVEEKKRLVSEVKALKLQVQQLQFSSNKSHRESAPQQIRAATFSWQQEKTPTRVPESPVGRGLPSSVFPWEQPRTPPHYNSRSPQQNDNKTRNLGPGSGSSQLGQFEEPGNAQLQELRKENQVLQCTMSELEVWVQSQEKEIKNHLNKLQEVQSNLEKSKAELAMKEQALSKSKDELMRVTVQQEQTNNKCALLEQKLKQVSEELSCQRQNAESVRRLMEQKSKDKEKEHQEELSDQQGAYRNLEHQCKQEKNQLNQEIQKLKTEHLALQSAIDKMAAQKQLVDRELEEVKAKFRCAEKELATHQRKGDSLQESLQEALKEKDRISTWQDQSTQRIVHLEAQMKRLEKQLNLSEKAREAIKTENLTLASKLKDLQQKLEHEFHLNSGNAGLAAMVSELSMTDQNEVNECEPGEEQESHQSNDGQFDGTDTVVGWPVKVGEKMLDSMEGSQLGELELLAKSITLDQDNGTNIKEDPSLNTEVKLEAVQSGAWTESRSLEAARDVFPDPEEKAGTQLQELDKETKKEFKAGGAETAVRPSDSVEKGQAMTDWLDKPITVSVHLREHEVELDEVKTKNQMLQRELDNLKQMLDSKVIEGQKSQQTVAELRQKLKQAMQRCAAEAEYSTTLVTVQAGQISTLEKDLEHERVNVSKLQETNKMLELECSKFSELTRSKAGPKRSDEDEIQILQNAASEKIQQLEQQIVELNSEKSCIEAIIKADGRPVVVAGESSDDLLECLEHRDAQNLELSEMSLNQPNHVCCDPREMLEQKLNEEKTCFMEIMKGGDGSGHKKDNRGLFLEYLKHKVVERLEFDEQLLEHRKHLVDLQQQCNELTIEKEQEEKAKRYAQDKFDNLQSKIHRETQQLTVALEAQSKNIEGLLLSMEEKDQTILVLSERLQNSLKVLSCLRTENYELKTNLKTNLDFSKRECVDNADFPRNTVLEQTSGGQFSQASRKEHEKGGVLSVGEQAPPINGRAVPADGTVQNSELSHGENLFDHSLLLPKDQAVHLILTREDEFVELKVPLLISSAVQKMPKPEEDPEKQAQQITKAETNSCKKVSDVPKGQRAGSVPSTGALSDESGMTMAGSSARQNIIQLTQGIESLRKYKELGYVESDDSDVAQHWQNVRCSDGLQMKIGELEEEMTLHTKKSQDEAEALTEEGTAEIADSKFALGLEGKRAVDELRTEAELIEEVERVTGKLNEALKVSEEEHRVTKELNQKVIHALNKELNSLNEKCTILEQEKEQLCLEVQKAQEAASDLQSEKEDLLNTIQSSGALLRGSTEERSCFERELGALREWKQKALEGTTSCESGKENGQVERHTLQESMLEMQNQMQELEEECKALNSAVTNAKHSQEQLQEKLEQTRSEKSELQNQVGHLQKIAVELNKEKVELQAKLKQWERSPVGKEEIPGDVTQENGPCEDLLPDGSQQKATAQTTASKLGADLEALRQSIQKKSEEVDRNLLNYSDHLSKRQELEASNKILFKAVNHLYECKAETLKSDQWKAAGSESRTSIEDKKPVAGQHIGGEPAQAGEWDQIETSQRSKGHANLAGHLKKLNPAELVMKINTAELAARIQKNRQFRHHLSVAFDETEYEPYGLPDVVQKGFADIPSGTTCPHVLRRATLNAALCAQQQGEGQSLLSFFKALGGSSK
ncbi:centromere protein F-like isoform X1 [Carcharodon carcharias]|uniref:centromere protein F-like isoform X1 n=1 Tax=Carcharodon carcharias TaxID=13397 RepID=UPI001B7E0B27|nr:centromere protein F-like isoform X1 [Carcharodon carcharias]XP_041035907.1 centromere protein F-like isoform X1 [Carcharodon carcharias]